MCSGLLAFKLCLKTEMSVLFRGVFCYDLLFFVFDSGTVIYYIKLGWFLFQLFLYAYLFNVFSLFFITMDYLCFMLIIHNQTIFYVFSSRFSHVCLVCFIKQIT